MLLEGANATLIHSAAEDGFVASAELRHRCLAVTDSKMDSADHPLYEKFQAHIAGCPLSYQERITGLNLYCVALAGDYLEYAADKYRRTRKRSCKRHWDIVHLRDLYRTLTAILGGEDELVHINLLFPSAVYVRHAHGCLPAGADQRPALLLPSRDIETEKQAFQLGI